MSHKLTPEQREQILALRARGEKVTYLAALFRVSKSTVEDHVYPKVRETRNRRKRELRAGRAA